MPELCAMILQDAPPKLQTRRPDVPAELARAIVRCLEKQPEKRFDSVADFARAIARFGGANVEAVARTITKVDIAKVSPRASSTPRHGSVTDASWSDVSEPELPDAPPERRPSHYAAIGLGALLALVLVVIVGVLLFRMRSDRSAATPAPTTTALISSATQPLVTPPPSVETAVVPPTPTPTTTMSATPTTTSTAAPKPTTSSRPTGPRPKPTSSAAPTPTVPAPPPASAKPPPDTGLSNDRHG
jgi:serine/threonine-protein kinase